MIDLLAILTVLFWLVIPLFWIPVHFRIIFFRKLGLFTYIMPLITWLPLTYFIYWNRLFLVQLKISLPIVLNVIGILFFVIGSLLHIWTVRLLGLWGIIGVPEISPRMKKNLITGGPFSVIRHPTYFAHTLLFSGVFLITGVISVGIVTLLDFIIVNTVIIPLEEKELLNRFGNEYRRYKNRVTYRFFPWIF